MNSEEERPSSKQNIDLPPEQSESKLNNPVKDSDSNLNILENLPSSLPKEKQEIVTNIFSVAASSFSGPIPPPEILKGYEEVLPGSANRLLIMLEEQNQHRRDMEKNIIQSDIFKSKWGLIIGAVLAFFLFGSAVFLAMNDRELTATAIVGGTALSVIGLFVSNNNTRKEERIQKLKVLKNSESKKDN